jgi:hypothetical protein
MGRKSIVLPSLTLIIAAATSPLFAESLSPQIIRLEMQRLFSQGGVAITYSERMDRSGLAPGLVSQSLPDFPTGTPETFTLPSVSGSTLLGGIGTITVPADAQNLRVRLETLTSGARVDLFLRFGEDVVLTGGKQLPTTLLGVRPRIRRSS